MYANSASTYITSIGDGKLDTRAAESKPVQNPAEQLAAYNCSTAAGKTLPV